MVIFLVLMIVSALFLTRSYGRNPARFRKGWDRLPWDLRNGTNWPIALFVAACVLLLIGIGAVGSIESRVLVIAVIALALAAFGTAWLREFRFLINLTDDVFPGRNDKLIWGILLIVMPPVGVWLFRSYRMAHWPDVKAAKPTGFDELF